MDEESLSAMCLDFTVTRTVPIAPSSPKSPGSSSSSSPRRNPMAAAGGDSEDALDDGSGTTSNAFMTVELTPGGSGIDVDSGNVEECVFWSPAVHMFRAT